MVLYAYHTAVHASTGFSPFQLKYGRAPQFTGFSEPIAFDPTSYQAYLRDFLETNFVEAAQRKKAQFDKHSKECSFGVDDPVWVSIPTQQGNLTHGGKKGTGLSRPRAHQPFNANKCKMVGAYQSATSPYRVSSPIKRIRGCQHSIL